MLRQKLYDGPVLEEYQGNYKDKFGLSEDRIDLLERQIETDLIPAIGIDEAFDLDKMFDRFNVILGGIEL